MDSIEQKIINNPLRKGAVSILNHFIDNPLQKSLAKFIGRTSAFLRGKESSPMGVEVGIRSIATLLAGGLIASLGQLNPEISNITNAASLILGITGIEYPVVMFHNSIINNK